MKQEHVKEAWQNFNNLSVLAHSPLVKTKLCQDLIWEGDDGGYAVQALLIWTQTQLAAASSVRKQDNAKILWLRYVEEPKKKAIDVADMLNLTESNVRGRQRTAWKQTAETLAKEAKERRGNKERARWICNQRYRPLTDKQKELVGYLSVFDRPIPPQFLTTYIIPSNDQSPVNLNDLITANLIQLHKNRTVALHTRFKEYAQDQVTETQRWEWHRSAGYSYIERGKFLLAVYHWQQARRWSEAADLLIGNKNKLGEFEEGQSSSLQEWQVLLRKFERGVVSAEQWAQINILRGVVGQLLGEPLPTVMDNYRRALQATISPATEVEIFYRRAHANQEGDTPQALADLEVCRTIGRQHLDDDTQFWVVRALCLTGWIHITPYKAYAEAETWLRRAENALEGKIGLKWFGIRADVHNGWGELYKYQKKGKASLEQRRKARIAADLAKDPLRIVKMIYQLGTAYYELGVTHYARAQKELELGEQWAAQWNYHFLRGQIQNVLGAMAFHAHDFSHALTHYRIAYDASHRANNQRSIAAFCLGIAETLVELNEIAEARKFIAEGIQCAQQIDHPSLLQNFAELYNMYPELQDNLNDRQRQSIHFARQTGHITNQQYRKLTGCSQAQAVRDLKALVADNIFQRIGKGRGTKYILKQS